MRRPNGAGSVFKMKHKKLRKPYRAMVVIGWAPTGKAIRKSIGTFATSKEAFAALDKFTSNPLTAKDFENEKVTFLQCWEWGKADKLRRGTSKKTIQQYDYMISRLSPILDKPIKSLKFQQLQAVIDLNAKEVSHQSLSMLKAILQAAFSAAIKQEIIEKNIVPLLVLPAKEQSKIHQPFTPSEIATLWENVNHDEISRIVKVALIYIYTGLRPIELYKINLKDVFISDRYMIGGVKTQAGKNRVIPLANCIMPFVLELYKESKFARSETLVPKNWIPATPRMLTENIARHLKIENHLPHDFRHTFVTMSKNVGIDEFIIKKIVGHSTTQNITDVYTHKERAQLIAAVDKLPYGDGLKALARLSIS